MNRRNVWPQPDDDLPVYPWGSAPAHLRTRSRLRDAGLQPGRQGARGLIAWYGRVGRLTLRDGARFAHASALAGTGDDQARAG